MTAWPNFASLSGDQRPKPLKIAHCVTSAYAPENSLLAYEKAAELGADMVEVDLRVTADSQPVIAHDDDLSRLYGSSARVDSLMLAELQAVTILIRSNWQALSELIMSIPVGRMSYPSPTNCSLWNSEQPYRRLV